MAGGIPFLSSPVGFEGVLNVTIGDGSVVVPAGVVSGVIPVPYDCEPTGWVIVGDISGSISIDIWKDVLANGIPTLADSIVASAPIILSGALSNTDNTLTGWNKIWSANDLLKFNVNSASTLKRVDIIIKIKRL